jgi:hypothetical protein
VRRSIRLHPSLEQRLLEVAARAGVPVSVVVREAIIRHCDEVLGADPRTCLTNEIGVIQSEGGRARQTGQAFNEAFAACAGTEMREGYLATRDDRKVLNAEWGAVDDEGWPL